MKQVKGTSAGAGPSSTRGKQPSPMNCGGSGGIGVGGGVGGGGQGRGPGREGRPHYLPLQASPVGDVSRPAKEQTFHQVAQESNPAFNRSKKQPQKQTDAYKESVPLYL